MAEDKTIQERIKYASELCSVHDFNAAEPVLREVVKADPTQSDAWRLIATVDWFGHKDTDRAFDDLIEALRIDPKNTSALMLMGNLLLLEHHDLPSARSYYDKILQYEPHNAIAVNNIGGICMKQKMYGEAIGYFQKAIEADSTFPNSYYAMALCMKAQGKNMSAFDVCAEGMRNGKDRPENPGVKAEIGKLLMQQADIICGMTDFKAQIETFRKLAEDFGGHPVILRNDSSLSVPALLEYHPHFSRNEDIVRYNPEARYVPYSIVRELVRLQMLISETNSGTGRITGSSDISKKDAVDGFARRCLSLIVNDRIYSNYVGLRPLQLLSLQLKDRENIAFTDALGNNKSFAGISRILDLVASMQLRRLYGIDNIHDYRPTYVELDKASNLLDMLSSCLASYKPGDEYNLLVGFAESLDLGSLIEISDEPA